MFTYSKNKASYIHSKGFKVTYDIDKEDKVFYVFSDDAQDVANQYEHNKELRAFLDAFKDISKETRKIKEEMYNG